jgi:hemerythrin superfamily protein
MTEILPEEDVVTLLLEQHDRIRRLFDDVARTDSPGLKRDRLEQLRRLLAVHETAEELVTHPRARLNAGAVVDALLEEEHAGKELLSEVEQLDTDDPAFEKAFAALRTAVLEHADHEERAEFPILRRDNDEPTLRLMATAVRAAEAVAPTRPHAQAGQSATVNTAVGPIAGIVDRTRDAVRSVLG